MLESKVLHEHVNVSSLSPVQTSVQRLDVLRRSITDDLRFDGMNTCHFPLGLHQFLSRPCEHEIVTVCQTRYSIFLLVKQVLRAESKLESLVLDILLPITFPIAGRVPCSVHALLHQSHFSSVGAHSVLHWQSYQHSSLAFAWKYARDTSMCMIENISSWFAAIDIVAFNASNGGLPAYRSGRSLTPFFSTTSFSSTFSYTPRSRKYFSSSSRASRTACHGSSLPVVSSKHMKSCSCSSSRVCQHRVLFMIAFHETSYDWFAHSLFALTHRFVDISNSPNSNFLFHPSR